MPKKIGQDTKLIRKATCKNCGAKLEYYPREVKHHTTLDLSDNPDTTYWIECPECCKRVTVRSVVID